MSNEQIGSLVLKMWGETPLCTWQSDVLDEAADRLLGVNMTPEEAEKAYDEAVPVELSQERLDAIYQSVLDRIGQPCEPEPEDRVRELEAKLASAEAALRLAWDDLSEWRQFANYNVKGLLCGDQMPLPDPPQRPTVYGLEQTEVVLSLVTEAIAAIAKAEPTP